MNTKESNNHISTIAVLAVFIILAFCVVSVLISGANIFKNIVNRTDGTYSERVVHQYIFNKVRSADSMDAVSVRPFGSGTALYIRENVEGKDYNTVIYSDNGSLKEIYASAGVDVDPAFGEEIMKTGDVRFELDDSLLKVNISGQELYIDLSTGDTA